MSFSVPDVTLVSGVNWVDLYQVTGIPRYRPLIVQNKSSTTCLLFISNNPPIQTAQDGFAVYTTDVAYVHGGHQSVWARGNGKLVVMEYEDL